MQAGLWTVGGEERNEWKRESMKCDGRGIGGQTQVKVVQLS